MLFNIMRHSALLLLNNCPRTGIVMGMKHIMRTCLVLAALCLGTSVQAQACYADYKAKQDDPLRLHYGVIELRQGCSKGAAKSEATARLSRNGWILLNIVSVFGADGLDSRKDRAGPNFLRF